MLFTHTRIEKEQKATTKRRKSDAAKSAIDYGYPASSEIPLQKFVLIKHAIMGSRWRVCSFRVSM